MGQHAGRFSVFPIYHPAAALYDGSKREALENDFATLGELLRQAGIVAAVPDGSQPGGEDRVPQVPAPVLPARWGKHCRFPRLKMARPSNKDFSKKVEACLSTQSNTSTRPVG